MAKKKATKKSKSSKTQKEPLIVASKVKNYIRSKKMMTSTESLEGLSAKIYEMLDGAIDRAKANKRSTVKNQDL